MVAVLEKPRGTRARPRSVPQRVGDRGGGGVGDAGGGPQDVGGPGPHRDWPLVPALIVAVLLAALLTWLGMYTQIQANLTGAQLPGA